MKNLRGMTLILIGLVVPSTSIAAPGGFQPVSAWEQEIHPQVQKLLAQQRLMDVLNVEKDQNQKSIDLNQTLIEVLNEKIARQNAGGRSFFWRILSQAGIISASEREAVIRRAKEDIVSAQAQIKTDQKQLQSISKKLAPLEKRIERSRLALFKKLFPKGDPKRSGVLRSADVKVIADEPVLSKKALKQVNLFAQYLKQRRVTGDGESVDKLVKSLLDSKSSVEAQFKDLRAAKYVAKKETALKAWEAQYGQWITKMDTFSKEDPKKLDTVLLDPYAERVRIRADEVSRKLFELHSRQRTATRLERVVIAARMGSLKGQYKKLVSHFDTLGARMGLRRAWEVSAQIMDDRPEPKSVGLSDSKKKLYQEVVERETLDLKKESLRASSASVNAVHASVQKIKSEFSGKEAGPAASVSASSAVRAKVTPQSLPAVAVNAKSEEKKLTTVPRRANVQAVNRRSAFAAQPKSANSTQPVKKPVAAPGVVEVSAGPFRFVGSDAEQKKRMEKVPFAVPTQDREKLKTQAQKDRTAVAAFTDGIKNRPATRGLSPTFWRKKN